MIWWDDLIFWKDEFFLEVFLLLKDDLWNDFGDVSDENWGLGKVQKRLNQDFNFTISCLKSSKDKHVYTANIQ